MQPVSLKGRGTGYGFGSLQEARDVNSLTLERFVEPEFGNSERATTRDDHRAFASHTGGKASQSLGNKLAAFPCSEGARSRFA